MAAIDRLREQLRPMLESGIIRQEDVAARLSEIAKKPVSQATVSRYVRAERPIIPRHIHIRKAIEQLVREIDAGLWPPSKAKPAAAGAGRASLELIGDAERLSLLAMLADLSRRIALGPSSDSSVESQAAESARYLRETPEDDVPKPETKPSPRSETRPPGGGTAKRAD